MEVQRVGLLSPGWAIPIWDGFPAGGSAGGDVAVAAGVASTGTGDVRCSGAVPHGGSFAVAEILEARRLNPTLTGEVTIS